MHDTMMQTGIQAATNKGPYDYQRRMAIRMWETSEAQVSRPVVHAGYAKRRRWERSHLVQHMVGALLVVGMLMLMGTP